MAEIVVAPKIRCDNCGTAHRGKNVTCYECRTGHTYQPKHDPTALTGYSSAEFDAAIAEGGSKSKVEDRAKVYFRAQEILARDLPLAPLVDPAFIVLARDNVTGLGYMKARDLVTFQDYSLVRVKR